METIEFVQPIYTFDIDAALHVSNLSYIRWMEIGRLMLLDRVGLPVPDLHRRGFTPVLARTEIDYLRPLYLGDTLRVRLWLNELRRISARLAFRFLNQDDTLVAQAEQVALFLNLADRKPYRLPAELRLRFEPYLEAE